MFEMQVTLPLEKDLKVTILDYDVIGSDEEIGSTTIDLENRFLSRFYATCGLPSKYYETGTYQWRDSRKPTEILQRICQRNNWPVPLFTGSGVISIGKYNFKLDDFESSTSRKPEEGPKDQSLALHLLNLMDLVPEHVETRPLYNSIQVSTTVRQTMLSNNITTM
jgi:hypothetical protein